jgi:hypothetical protein
MMMRAARMGGFLVEQGLSGKSFQHVRGKGCGKGPK